MEAGKKMLTRVASLVVSVVLCLGLMPALSWADDNAAQGNSDAVELQGGSDAGEQVASAEKISVHFQLIGLDSDGASQSWISAGTYEVAAGANVGDVTDTILMEKGRIDGSQWVSGSNPYYYLNGVTSPEGDRTLGWDSETGCYWQLYVNGKWSQVGAGEVCLSEGDCVTWVYAAGDPCKVNFQVFGLDSEGNAEAWINCEALEVAPGSNAGDVTDAILLSAGLIDETQWAARQAYYFLDKVTSPDGDRTLGWDSETECYWQLFVNGAWSLMGAGDVTLSEGDSIIWVYAASKWEHLAGADRYETGRLIAMRETVESDVAVVATGANFPDALAASALAGAYDAPVILTNGEADSLDSNAKQALEGLHVKQVFIMGGEAAVSADVMDAIKGLNGGIEVERVAGSSRIGTSTEAYERVVEAVSSGESPARDFDTVILATASNFPDTLSIGPWSYAANAPILLVSGDTMDSGVEAAVAAADKVVIVGGTGAVSEAIENKAKDLVDDANNVVRLSGSDRYETSAEIAKWETGDSDAAVQPGATVLTFMNPAVATGKNFPDALAGAALCGLDESVLVLADSVDHPTVEPLVTHKGELMLGRFLGGKAAVGDEFATQIIGLTTIPTA